MAKHENAWERVKRKLSSLLTNYTYYGGDYAKHTLRKIICLLHAASPASRPIPELCATTRRDVSELTVTSATLSSFHPARDKTQLNRRCWCNLQYSTMSIVHQVASLAHVLEDSASSLFLTSEAGPSASWMDSLVKA